MNVRIVLFQEGVDPDSFARTHRPAEIKTYLAENARDFVRLKTSLLLEGVLNDPVKKAGLIKEVVSSISLIPDIITRSLYIKECAALMSIEEKTLIHEMNRVLRNKHRSKTSSIDLKETELIQDDYISPAQIEYKADSCDFQEGEIIRLLLTYGNEKMIFDIPNEFGRFDQQTVNVAEFIVNDLQVDEINFENNDYQNIYNEVTQYLSQHGCVPGLNYFTSHHSSRVSSLIINLLSNPYELSENWEKNKIYISNEAQHIKETVTTTILSLKAKKIKKQIRQYMHDIKLAIDTDEQIGLQLVIRRYKEVLDRINKELGRIIIP